MIATGISLEKPEIIAMEEFKTYLGKDNVQKIDVRGVSEHKEAHIDGADNIFVGTIPDNLDKIDHD